MGFKTELVDKEIFLMTSEFAEGELMLEIAKKWQVPWKCEEVTPMQV